MPHCAFQTASYCRKWIHIFFSPTTTAFKMGRLKELSEDAP